MIFTPWQKYKITKAQNNNLALRNSISYKGAMSFGIIFHNDEQDKIDAAERLGTLLKMDGKTVKTIAYEHKTTIKHLPYETFTKANFDFWGNFIGKPLLDFANATFDFLICLDAEPNTLVQSVLANSKAKCRIGRYKEENQQSFEMLLFDKETTAVIYIEQLYQYLKKIS